MRNQVTIMLDSINEAGARITTFALEYPLFIHNQVLTHRVFSRCSSSARAIPVRRVVDEIERDPAIPEVFRKNQKGMSPGEPLDSETNKAALEIVREHMDSAFATAVALSDLGVHKQWANRYLAPFAHVRTILTGTDWENFYHLRDSEHAQDEIAELARAMRIEYDHSIPTLRTEHFPFIMGEEKHLHRHKRAMISSARCARASYQLHGTGILSTPENDIPLCRGLISHEHMSPLEHPSFSAGNNESFANFSGWIQFRSIYKDLAENEPFE